MPSSRSWRSSAASRCFSMWRRPAAGSSSSSSSGSTQSARAISTMRCWPSARVPASWSHLVAEADALDLARGLGEQLRLLGAVEPQHARERAGAAAQMRAERDVLEHGHVGHQLDVLEGARDAAARRRPAAAAPSTLLAEHRDVAAGRRQHAGDQVEGRALAGAVRADQPDDLARADVEDDVVDRDQAAELLARLLDLQQRAGAAGARSRRERQRVSSTLRRGCAAGAPSATAQTPSAPAAAAAPAGCRTRWSRSCRWPPMSIGQTALQLVLQDHDDAGAEQRAPDIAGAAEHRHEQVFDAGI